MMCPTCAKKCRILATRRVKGSFDTIRRQECDEGHRFTTIETVIPDSQSLGALPTGRPRTTPPKPPRPPRPPRPPKPRIPTGFDVLAANFFGARDERQTFAENPQTP